MVFDIKIVKYQSRKLFVQKNLPMVYYLKSYNRPVMGRTQFPFYFMKCRLPLTTIKSGFYRFPLTRTVGIKFFFPFISYGSINSVCIFCTLIFFRYLFGPISMKYTIIHVFVPISIIKYFILGKYSEKSVFLFKKINDKYNRQL